MLLILLLVGISERICSPAGKFIISTGREGFREVSTPQKIVQWHLSDIKGTHTFFFCFEKSVVFAVSVGGGNGCYVPRAG